MAMAWFRFYHEALDDPKVQRLDPATFKHWVNLLCLACRHDGKLPSNADIAYALRIDEIALETLLERLLNATLIGVRNGGPNGSHIALHGWDKRQYKSDTSTERVKRFRNVSATANETGPDTDTDTDILLAKANSKIADPGKVFWDAAIGYLGEAKRGVIGKLARDHGRDAVGSAITVAMLQTSQPPDRLAYVIGILNRQASGASNGYPPGHSGIPL